MRIVQLLPELNEGGVERGVVELSRELVALGHESVVISGGGRLASCIEADGGRHITMDMAGKNAFTAFSRAFALRRALAALQPDILHARSRVPAWLAVIANRSLGIPFVTTVHGFNSISPYSLVMTFGDRVICVSNSIREYVRTHYAVPEEKCVVIPRGIDLELFDPASVDRTFMDAFTRQYGLDGRFVVTSVGRITRLKDYETFIRAISILKEQNPDVLALIVGGARDDKQDYYASLQTLKASLGLEQHIVFTGSQAKVAEIYALSSVVVSSSNKPESFGRSAAEALAMNVPVAATGHGGMLDIVIPGVTGELFRPMDPDGLANAIRLCSAMERSSLRNFVAERFNLEQMVESTLSVYRDVTASSQESEKRRRI